MCARQQKFAYPLPYGHRELFQGLPLCHQRCHTGQGCTCIASSVSGVPEKLKVKANAIERVQRMLANVYFQTDLTGALILGSKVNAAYMDDIAVFDQNSQGCVPVLHFSDGHSHIRRGLCK